MRSLRREMVDGAAIVATRSYAVRFFREEDGFRLEGEEDVAPEVSGPASLEAILRLERERRDGSMFPLCLDRDGRIIAENGEAGSPQLARAIDAALHRIAASPAGDDEQAAMRAFVTGLHQAAASLITEPPADLFHPLAAPRSESREVALPDGGRGEVAVTFSAALDPATGLMREAERVVLTRLGTSERRTAERWTLGPI